MFNDPMFDEGPFFRKSRRGSSFERGNLKYILLDSIRNKPRHGYDIIRELEEKSYGFYRPSPGVIYPTLQMLEEMGLVTSAEQEGKKVYSITEEGLTFLAKKKDIADGVRSHMKRRWSHMNMGRISMVLREYRVIEHLLAQGFRKLNDDKAERICEILSRVYQDIEAALREQE